MRRRQETAAGQRPVGVGGGDQRPPRVAIDASCLSRHAVLSLQRLAGNGAVVSRLPIQRDIQPTAAPGTVVVRGGGRDQERFAIEKIVGSGRGEGSRVPMCLLIPIAADGRPAGMSRLVRLDDSAYVQTAETVVRPTISPTEAAEGTSVPPFVNPEDYSIKWWFNYFWAEVSDATKVKERMVAETTPEDEDALRDSMERMFIEGLIEVGRDVGVVRPDQTSRGGGAGPVYNVELPRLTGTELGYRADSRDWDRIQAQSGSRPVARVPGLLDARGLTKPWNPLRSEERRKKMYLRKNSQDNALETVVSVAHDVRDTVTFPKPNQTSGPGGLATGGEEQITIYVVWVPGAMDTSGLALDLWNASRWVSGEVGAYEVPADNHLAQFTVRRFYDPRVDSFVVGKVTDFKLLQPALRVLQLPDRAVHGLKALTSMWEAGEIGWFRFGDPEKGNARHAALVSMWELGAERIAARKERSPMIRRMRTADLSSEYQQVYKDLGLAWDAEEAACKTWLAARRAAVGARTNVAGAKAAVEAHASDLSKSFANTRFTYVRQRLNPHYFALLEAAKQIGDLAKGKDDEARTIAKPVIDGVRAAVAAAGEQIARSRERWRAEAPRDDSPPERWEAFLMKVLADPGA